MVEVPSKYQADPRPYEDKQWLYEKYWGQLKPLSEIADRCGVSRRQLNKYCEKFGIPRRHSFYRPNNSVSPFRGFYSTDSPTRCDEKSMQSNEEQRDTEREHDDSRNPDAPFSRRELAWAESVMGD